MVSAYFLLFVLLTTMSSSATEERRHTVFVLVGGTGDLAAKYLWDGLFSIFWEQSGATNEDVEYQSESNRTFDFISAGRSAQDKGSIALNNILSKSVKNCPTGISSKLCEEIATNFINKVMYVPVKESEDYAFLCTKIQSMFSRLSHNVKRDVVLYLAISPSAYESVTEMFHESCSGNLKQDKISLTVGLEKPFGLDVSSAKAMSEKLLSRFNEDQIYRVDHYLGKTVVKSILSFRLSNPHIENRLDKDNVDRVEIFLKETVGVGDRLSVYNSMGVLRDVHQNHLTQLLALLTMDLPTNLSDDSQVEDKKGHLLSQVFPVKPQSCLFAQYSGYKNDNKTAGDMSLPLNSADPQLTILPNDAVPTFAATLVNINSPRWHKVPFLLVSGKKLDTRESYIRVVFKSDVCVSQCGLHLDISKNGTAVNQPQIVFNLNQNDMKLRSETVLVTKDLGEVKCPPGLTKGSASSGVVYGEKVENLHICEVLKSKQAYESLFADLLARRRTYFVSTNHLLLSWQIWDQIIKAPKDVIVYDQQDVARRLNFRIRDGSLMFVNERTQVRDDNDLPEIRSDEGKKNDVITKSSKSDFTSLHHAHTPASFLGRKLVTSHTERLAYLLARDIDRAAEQDITSKGSFHIALAGGRSLPQVFRALAQSFASGPHWPAVHIWQVDERCVPHSDPRSNWMSIDRELLRFTAVPLSNIHPMPHDCDPDLNADRVYTEFIRGSIAGSSFDFVVLGLGDDGHVASLFPETSDLHVQQNSHILLTDSGPSDTRQRLTMTLPLINRSRRVAIFATGSHKQNIVGILEEVEGEGRSVDKYPVLGVNPLNGTLTWYMDYDSYTGLPRERVKER